MCAIFLSLSIIQKVKIVKVSERCILENRNEATPVFTFWPDVGGKFQPCFTAWVPFPPVF